MLEDAYSSELIVNIERGCRGNILKYFKHVYDFVWFEFWYTESCKNQKKNIYNKANGMSFVIPLTDEFWWIHFE